MAFGIKLGYRENPCPVYFVDDPTSTRGIVFQPDVYTLAEFLADGKITDVGCGWGDKLAAIHDRHPGWAFTGIDFDANLQHCKDTYDWGQWLEVDLERVESINAAGAVLVCSDVIEHLADPTALVNALRSSDAELIVLSTPERDVEHGYDHRGPSPNLCHIREWNAQELHAYLDAAGFEIIHHGLTRGNDQGWAMGTQLVVMRP